MGTGVCTGLASNTNWFSALVPVMGEDRLQGGTSDCGWREGEVPV